MTLHPDMASPLAVATFGSPSNKPPVSLCFVKAFWRDSIAGLGGCTVAPMAGGHGNMLWSTIGPGVETQFSTG